MKRKSIGEVTDYSLFSSPAIKIRRLDAELSPSLEEECEIPMRFEPLVPREQSSGSKSSGVKIEEIQSENGERAIVLASPLDTPLRRLQSNFSLSVAPHILSGLKNGVGWLNESSVRRIVDDEEQSENSNDQCLALVPWVPSSLPHLDAAESSAEVENSDMMMDDEDAGDQPTTYCAESMVVDQASAAGYPYQWHLQHCFNPQPIHSYSSLTPVTWYS